MTDLQGCVLHLHHISTCGHSGKLSFKLGDCIVSLQDDGNIQHATSGCGRWTGGFILFNAAALHMSPGMVNVIRSLPACRNLSVEWTRTIYRMNWTYWAEVVWSHWPPFVWVLLWAIDSLGKFLSRCYPFVEELLGGKKKSSAGYTHSKDWNICYRQQVNMYVSFVAEKPSNPWTHSSGCNGIIQWDREY